MSGRPWRNRVTVEYLQILLVVLVVSIENVDVSPARMRARVSTIGGTPHREVRPCKWERSRYPGARTGAGGS